MKQLNLRSLRNSNSKKEVRIYQKARAMIVKGFRTKEVREEEVMELASKFPTLKVKVLAGGDLSIRSRGRYGDMWQVSDEGRFYVLYHDSLGFNTSKKKDPMHVQDVFEDLGFIFASIVSHDEFELGESRLSNFNLLRMSM